MSNVSGYARLFENFENVEKAKECQLIGKVPKWLNGTMIRNGPGMFEIGDTKYNHWFDGLAYLQKYHFENGKMFYSAKYLESDCYQINTSKNRIVCGSFGTASFSDPCKTIFSRFFSYFFEKSAKHDNANVSFSSIGDQIYACTETPHMYQIDINTLNTGAYTDFSKYVSLHSCTAHQLADYDGNVYNIGSRFGKDAAHVFTITQKPSENGDEDWELTKKIGEIQCSDPFNPTYIHSFGMSENYLIMFESPIRINIKKLLLSRFLNSASYRECLYWDETKNVKVFILNKKTGEKHPINYWIEPFFTFHHANTFEKDNCLVVDYCRINEAGNFDTFLIEHMKTGDFKSDPKKLPYLTRLIIPLSIDKNDSGDLLENIEWANGCHAYLQKDGTIQLIEKRISEISLEFPRFNTNHFNMREYKYCYGSSVLGEIRTKALVGVVKVNVENETTEVWHRENEHQICGEPVFVENPQGKAEDDGILIVPVMTLKDGKNPFVLILDAKTMLEIGRFMIPEARIPLGFHALYQSQIVGKKTNVNID